MVKMPHWPTLWQNHEKHNLTRMKNLLAALKNPHLKIPPVIHVAGTNGKGSTIAYLKAIFEACNYTVHSYTSPHLLYFNERIIIASNPISDKYLFDIIEVTRIAAEIAGVTPSFFEAITAAAFLAFAQNKADILLLETGLGGRLDATNVVDHPLASVITSISYDHMEYLGPTLTTIAAEKAGIIKAGSPCIISCQIQKIYDYLIDYCIKTKAAPIVFEYEFGVKKQKDSFLFLSKNFNYQFPLPSLIGDHQIINAATAIATCKSVAKHFHFTNSNIQSGLHNAVWPARLEKINPSRYIPIITKMNKNNEEQKKYIPQIWIDGAHNPGGAQVLSNFIKDNLKQPIFLILGMTNNRDVKSFLSYFNNIITQAFSVGIISEPASYTAEKLALYTNNANIPCLPATSLEDAIINSTKLSTDNSHIIITGSLFLASDFYKLLQQQ